MAVKKTEKLASSRVPVRSPSFSDGIIYQPHQHHHHHHHRRRRCLSDQHHRHHCLFLASPLQ